MPLSSREKTSVFKVIDSWAMLAWLRDETPAARVNEVLLEAEARKVRLLMSWINVGEVFYMLTRKHNAKAAEEFLKRLPTLPVRLVLPEDEDIIAAATLKSTRRLSYADGFAAALAQRESASLLTGDPELRAMGDVITIEWLA